jgi:hypothetical protein
MCKRPVQRVPTFYISRNKLSISQLHKANNVAERTTSAGWLSIFQSRLIIFILFPFKSLLASLNTDGATNFLTWENKQFEYHTFINP